MQICLQYPWKVLKSILLFVNLQEIQLYCTTHMVSLLSNLYRCTGVQVCTVILYNTHGQPAIKLEPRIEWMTPPATHTRTCPFIRFCVAKNITQPAITDILLLKHYLRSVLGFIPLAPKNGSVSCCNLQKCDSNFCSWSRNKEWKIAL